MYVCMHVCIVFVAASHQTQGQNPEGLLKWGGDGRELAETRILLVCAAHRPTKCNVGLMRQAVSRIQISIRARMLGYSLN